MPTIDDILGSSGVIAAALGAAFESRPEQITMARAVARAMEARSHLLAEAGTGVGKSFAYLVPAMLRCIERGERVVIATHTIALQEQIVDRDVPFLAALLASASRDPAAGPSRDTDGHPFDDAPNPDRSDPDPSNPDSPEPASPIRAALVKGRGNYLSIRRLRLASSRQDRLFPDPAAKRSLHVIEDWAYGTTDGTLSTLPPLERPGVWSAAQSDSGNCMGRKCPTYEQCFYQRSRRRMEQANLLICNHALFFADLALREQDAAILPDYQHVVLDEAHMVEDVASEHFGLTLAEGRVAHLLGQLVASRGGRGFLPQLTLTDGGEGVSRAVALVEQAHAASRAFFESLGELVAPAGDAWTRRGGDSGPGVRRLREPGVVDNVLTPAMRELSLRLKGLKDAAKVEADKYELNAYSLRAEAIAASAEALVSQSIPGCAYWVESARSDGGQPRVEIACAPVEVGPLLKARLFNAECSVVLTSATLATRGSSPGEPRERAEAAFTHAMARLGCDGADTLQLGSPFDYPKQARVIIDGGDDRADALSRRILRHVQETDGGAFVLFTSFAMLNAVASRLAGPLAAAGLPMLAQGRDGSRTAILQRFRESERSVLLGAASFWQGVDVRGRGLRNVIITKLPFEPPDRPLTQARLELIEARGGNPFLEDSLPRAVIRFKQGLGRLIRSREDQGRIVILDGRIATARYGRSFLAAIPPGVPIEHRDPDPTDQPDQPY